MTQTPWKLHTESLIIGPGGSLDHVARVVRNADAAFIVKAVNLHEKLLANLKWLHEKCACHEQGTENECSADEAIAKAEGRHD